MDMKDVSSRLKKARETQEPQKKPMDFAESYRIRAKMVGLLIHDARLNIGRTAEDCARFLKVTPEQIEAWEFGDEVPSLPQLEILAFYLDVPVSHFWSTSTLESEREKPVDAQADYLALRDRMIGALLRMAREEGNISLEEISEATNLPVEQITRYELGEESLPLHELSVLAGAVKRNLSYFLETSSHVGELLAVREQWKHFADLPEDIRNFAANPLNIGFIEIAIMFSQMPTDRLRQVGESVLNITM